MTSTTIPRTKYFALMDAIHIRPAFRSHCTFQKLEWHTAWDYPIKDFSEILPDKWATLLRSAVSITDTFWPEEKYDRLRRDYTTAFTLCTPGNCSHLQQPNAQQCTVPKLFPKLDNREQHLSDKKLSNMSTGLQADNTCKQTKTNNRNKKRVCRVRGWKRRCMAES